MKSYLMIAYAMAALSGNYLGSGDVHIDDPEPAKIPKRTEPLLSYGNGRIKYEFETKWGIATIWADNPKAARKKLVTLEGINRNFPAL